MLPPHFLSLAAGRIVFSMDQTNLVLVQSYNTRPEADLAKAELDAAGIQSMIQADTAGGMREHLAWSGAGFKLLVREQDASAARDLLASTPDPKAMPDSGVEGNPDASNPWRRFT